MYPMFLADRDRNKLRLVLDWAPIEPLSINFVTEQARDTYTTREVGLRDGKAQLYSIDAAYTFSEKWQANAWMSRNDTRSNMLDCRATTPTVTTPNACPNTAASETWEADLRTVGDAIGIGTKGKPSGALEVGADLQYYNDRALQTVNVLSPGATPAASFPDIVYKHTTLRLHGRYALNRNSGIRVQYVHDRYKISDWTWTNFVYGTTANPTGTDGTTISQSPDQKVNFIGVSYYHEFR
jgi:hypothetical protein